MRMYVCMYVCVCVCMYVQKTLKLKVMQIIVCHLAHHVMTSAQHKLSYHVLLVLLRCGPMLAFR